MVADRSANAILASLSAQDFALVENHLQRVEMPLRMELERPNRVIEHAYFPESGFASVVATSKAFSTEIGLIGREGMTGIPIILGADRSPHNTFAQAAGYCMRIAADSLRDVMGQSMSLHTVLMRWVHVVTIEIAHTALANAHNTIDERLARWLLMADDRVDDKTLRLTHDFLSLMLGTHRPSVTLALHTLEAAKLIKASRGQIKILDREKLRRTAGDAYGVAEAERERLFPARSEEKAGGGVASD